ncbi:hypothetical protein [Streptomyces sp. 8L]|uniref:hypothetical protein n=1 Tax=Streptomyces sp. 8L TaxID=2877242 RepID=UPI001CD51F67|nr:hypothetical protein [Streptomyces sp. 8L]MCA1217383.1 hypothetical protein [Streptomyces sp. 8L]
MDIPARLIELEQSAVDAYAEVLRLQEVPGRPTAEWTPEEHEAWNAAHARWREAVLAVQSAVAEHAAAADGVGRLALEMAVKAAVRHPEAAEG